MSRIEIGCWVKVVSLGLVAQVCGRVAVGSYVVRGEGRTLTVSTSDLEFSRSR